MKENGSGMNSVDAGDAIIRISKVAKSFDDVMVFDSLDLTINKGESLVVLGRSGCGKSVMLKTITGLIRPDRGSVFFKNHDITKLSRKKLFEIRMSFGMLFQGSALFDSMSVGENVALPLRKHTDMDEQSIREMVNEKLELVGLNDVYHKYPGEMSGGMKKRVGLARAVVMNPEVVLYDEPTTGLDPIMADNINDLIRDLQGNMNITSVVVTHDIKSAYKVGDRLAMLSGGRIIFSGTPEEVRNTDEEAVRQFVDGNVTGFERT
jgi:phospholipid/cholesterol/gamma-HCH transport system ATP-binding protein